MAISGSLSRRNFLSRASAIASVGMAMQSSTPLMAQKGPKIFVLWDMEGSSGVFTREQAWYWEPGVRENVAAEARALFTDDANALSAAALEAGASELIVCDTHHGGGNFLRDKLSTDARISYQYRSRGLEDGKMRWMAGLDQSVKGLMLPGHHAKTFTENAFMPHTNNFEWADFQINGQSVGEIGVEACYAGHWDIPLIFVQGDEAACYEARRQFPGVVTAVVKRAIAPEQCEGLTPEAAHREMARAVAEAVRKARTSELKPFKTNLPMTITVRMRTADGAAKVAKRPGVLRLDDHTVQGRAGRQCDVLKWITGDGLEMGS